MSENYTTDGHTITPEDATANATASGRRSIFITGAAVRSPCTTLRGRCLAPLIPLLPMGV